MSFGLRIPANDKGAVIDTSKSVAGFALVDAFDVGAGGSGTRSYPELVGFTLHTNEIAIVGTISYETQYGGVHNTTVGVGVGNIPYVSYSPGSAPLAPATRIFVFAK